MPTTRAEAKHRILVTIFLLATQTVAQDTSAAPANPSELWVAVENLIAQRDKQAALKLVRGVTDADLRGALSRYIDSRPKDSDALQVGDRIHAAKAKRLANSPSSALQLLDGLKLTKTVFSVQLEEERSLSLRDLGRREESERRGLSAAKIAHAIGWNTRRNRLLRYLCYSHYADDGVRALSSSYLILLRKKADSKTAIVVYVAVHWEAGDELIGVVVTPMKEQLVPLGPWPKIRAACASLESIKAGGESSSDQARAVLLEPLNLPPTIERLVIMPQIRLSRTPFALLAPHREIIYQCYTQIQIEEKERGNGVLVIEAPSRTTGAVRSEAEEARTDLLTGGDATRGRFLATAKRKRWRAIHITCDPLDARGSLTLASTKSDSGRITRLELIKMRLSADLVVLSAGQSANVDLVRGDGGLKLPTGPPGIDDPGFEAWIKQMEEALKRMDTGSFRERFGTRYMFEDHCPRVLVSLWDVDPGATNELMKVFYSTWDKSDAATALLAAQQAVRTHDAWKHPYYWAGWQLWGLP